MVIGMNVIRAVQVTTLCRTAAHMYSQNVDFSQSQNQQELVKVAQGLNITATSGNGVIILTRVQYVTSTACGSQACANENQYVMTNRIVIGNSSLHSSIFGSPPAADMQTNGDVIVADYLNDPYTVAANFSNIMTLTSGQYLYVAETYFTSPDLNWWGGGVPQINIRFVF